VTFRGAKAFRHPFGVSTVVAHQKAYSVQRSGREWDAIQNGSVQPDNKTGDTRHARGVRILGQLSRQRSRHTQRSKGDHRHGAYNLRLAPANKHAARVHQIE